MKRRILNCLLLLNYVHISISFEFFQFCCDFINDLAFKSEQKAKSLRIFLFYILLFYYETKRVKFTGKIIV